MTTLASDNTAPVHPAVFEALERCNVGYATPYGGDAHTAACTEAIRRLLGSQAEVMLVWGGTGANVVGLASVLGQSDAVLCSDVSHINVDEGGAPERLTGAKLIDLPTRDAKLTVESLRPWLARIGDPHAVQPKVVSLTQSTELGTVYQPDEVADISDFCHAHGLVVHMDGARIANATAALGGDIAAATRGVDILSFGGTKNGMMYGEAVVYLNPELSRHAQFVRKQSTQLPSKARYIAAQFNALFHDDLWLANAHQANAMARRLYDGLVDVPGITFDGAPLVNGLFPCLPAEAIAELQRQHYFYVWNAELGQVRWMTSWCTQADEIDAFVVDVRRALNR